MMPKQAERLGIKMRSVHEYDLRELGPWERESDTLWCAPDPDSDGMTSVWWGLQDGVYTDCSGSPLYFAGTELHRRGHPPPEVESDVGTPCQQWEAELRASDREAWFRYRQTGQW